MFSPSRGQEDEDAGIRSTDLDASMARFSAVQRGYLHDPFVRYFMPRAQIQEQRSPVINIGTFIRSESIDRLIFSWLDSCIAGGKQCQIVSLGAGSDTRYWRLKESEKSACIAKYVEIDFPENTTKKAMAIKKHKALSAALEGEVTIGGGGPCLYSGVYNLISGDLRKPDASFGSLVTPEKSILNTSLPTLLLFECVLAYIPPAQSTNLVTWFAERFESSGRLGVVVYEMFGLNDSFGYVMKNHLRTRNIELPGVEPYNDIQSLERRFLDLGFQISRAVTLKGIRREILPPSVDERIRQQEGLDEVEELDHILAHYAITWARLSPQPNTGLNDIDAWDLQWSTQWRDASQSE